MNCSNCQTKIGKPLIGKANNKLNEDLTHRLNQFLPEELRKPSFCQKCLDTSPDTVAVFSDHIQRKVRKYINRVGKNKKRLLEDLDGISVKIMDEKRGIYDIHKEKIKLFSTIPPDCELIEYVESFMVVDSGMWSTSSDNLDAMWSVIHDNAARRGSDSLNKLGNGFRDTKELIKKSCFIKGGNAVVDTKYSFSELAGNGKILVHCQGTAARLNTTKSVDFSDIYKKYDAKKMTLEREIEEADKLISLHSEEKLRELLFSFK